MLTRYGYIYNAKTNRYQLIIMYIKTLRNCIGLNYITIKSNG